MPALWYTALYPTLLLPAWNQLLKRAFNLLRCWLSKLNKLTGSFITNTLYLILRLLPPVFLNSLSELCLHELIAEYNYLSFFSYLLVGKLLNAFLLNMVTHIGLRGNIQGWSDTVRASTMLAPTIYQALDLRSVNRLHTWREQKPSVLLNSYWLKFHHSFLFWKAPCSHVMSVLRHEMQNAPKKQGCKD